MRQLNPDFLGTSSIDALIMNTFCACWLEAQSRHLQTTFLEEALRSGEFLEYNRESDAIEVGVAQGTLLRLLHEIRGYDRVSETISTGTNLFAKYTSKNANSKTTVQNADLIGPLALLDQEVSLVKAFAKTYRSLATGTWASDVPVAVATPVHLGMVFDVPVRQIPTSAEATQWIHDLDEPI